MKNLLRLVAGTASAVFFFASAALAQTSGTVTTHAFAIGKGAGMTGYNAVLCTAAQIPIGQTSADPICRTVSGDITINSSGAVTIGANKVVNSMLATMAANTTKCNATAGSAVPTDCDASTMRTNIGLGTAATQNTVPISMGGTGQTTAALARTALGLAIGTNVQAWDADLDAFALKTAPSGAVVGTTDTQTISGKSIDASQLTGSVAAARMPALTGDVTSSAGAVATTIANSAVTNAKMANAAAYTLKGNPTGSSAAPQDFTVAGLTQKATPATSDLVMIQDSAASNATKYATVGSISSAGGVSSIAGNTGAFTLSNGITNSTNDIRLASIANLTALANVSGASAAPSATTIREVLTADRTYYVRTDGSDSNTGLVNNSGGAWLTLQYAADWIGGHIDYGSYAVTVQVGAGTYTAGLSVTRPFVGYNWVKFKGDETTPSNVLISVGAGYAFQATHAGARFKLGGFKIANAGCAAGVYASAGGEVYIDGVMDFGTIGTSGGNSHIYANAGGYVITSTAYNITGSSYAHFYANYGGVIEAVSAITLTGTPNFSGAFAFGYRNGTIGLASATYSGSATGTRWYVEFGGGVDSTGITLPGNGAGITTSPGWKN